MEVTCQVLASDEIEQVWCSVKNGSESVLFGCVYRPPLSNLNVTERVVKSIKAARDLIERGTYDSLILCGDFNFPDIVWTSKCTERRMDALNYKAHQLPC